MATYGFECSAFLTQDKIILKQQLLQYLQEPVRSIRSNVAYTISKIAHIEFPEQWPSFFDELMNCLGSSSIHVVQGAIQVLGDFVRDDLTDLAFPVVAPVLMPKLFELFTSENVPVEIRANCIGIVSEFADIIYMVKEEHPEVVQSYLEPLLRQWMDGFLSILQMPLNENTAEMKSETLKAIVKLVRAFPKQMNGMVSTFLEIAWKELVNLQKTYQEQFVEASVEPYSDKESQHLESIIYSALDFIQMVARKKSGKSVIGGALKDMLAVIMTYLQITACLEDTWAHDMNQFIQDDDDDAISHSVRLAVEQCIASLMDAFPESAPTALFHTCMDLFITANSQKESGGEHWWKIHESCLFIIGRFPSELIEASKVKGLDMEYVMRVVLEDINYDSMPFLQGRALWFSSQFATSLPETLVKQFLEAAVQALHSSIVNEAIKIFAMKSIRGFLSSVNSETLKPFQSGIIEGLLKLTDVAREDCLILLLETLVLAIKVNKEVTARYEEFLSNMLLKLWNQSAQDVFIMELLQELFTIMSANRFVAIPFQTRMFPVLVSSLSAEVVKSNPQITFTSLDLITSLIKNVADPFPTVYTTDMYPNAIRLLLDIEDSGLLQNGQELLKVLVHRDFEGIKNLRIENRSGLEYLLEFVGKMLAPSESESSAIFIGSLITKLIQKGGDQLVPFLPQLLTAVIHRLDTAKMPAFVETLVLIFCHLIEPQSQTVISFLSEIKLQGYTGLELFLRSFCGCFHDLQGAYTVKLGALAMMQLLSSRDPRLMSIQVKGDLIVNNSKRIVTRSRSKDAPDQYTTTVFPVKALALVLDEYQSQLESKMKVSRSSNAKENEIFDSEEEYETCSEQDDDPFGYWSIQLSNVDEDFEEDSEDDEMKDSAVYQLDLVQAIKRFVQDSHQADPAGFESLCQSLSAHHRGLVAELI
jgi:hypothetical protein